MNAFRKKSYPTGLLFPLSLYPPAQRTGVFPNAYQGKFFKEQAIGTLISGDAATVPSNMLVASVDVCFWG
jgi:hypothetical protein